MAENQLVELLSDQALRSENFRELCLLLLFSCYDILRDAVTQKCWYITDRTVTFDDMFHYS